MLGLAILRVSVYRGGDFIGAENFRIRHIIVGRDPTMADLVIGSGKVSREHVLLEHDGNRVFVHDLLSTNGIFVNGLRVDRAEVGPTDVVLLGEHFLRLELRGRAHTPEPEPDEPYLEDSDFPSLAAVDAIDEQVDMGRPIPVPAALARSAAHAAAGHADDAFYTADDPEEDRWSGPSFPLVERLLDDQPRIEAEMPLRQLRLAILKTREQQALDMRLIRPGRRFAAPAVALKERWGAIERIASPLVVRWTAKGQANVQVLERSRWTLRRGVGLWDETAGVREGWARRRRGGVWVTLQRNEMLAVQVGAVTYNVRFVPVPAPVLRGPRQPRDRRIRWALGISGLLHALVIGTLALSAYLAPPDRLAPPVSWIPHDDESPVLVTLPLGAPVEPASVASLAAATETTAEPEPLAERGTTRPPGGSQGYRFFGLIDAPISYDPQVPPPAGGLSFKRAAAFLRGDGTGLGQLIPHSGAGPQWRWVADPQGITSSDPGRLTPAAANALVAQNSGPLQSCYERYLPRDAGLSGRVSLSWQVAGHGGVRTVYPGPQLVEPPLLGCFTEVIKRWRYARFSGSDITLNYTLVFKREGFE